MYIITDNKDVIIHISETIGYQENGNVLVDNDTLAIAKPLVKGVYEVENIEENVTEIKYCYTEEKGFYANENYKEPEPTEAEKIKELKQQINILQAVNEDLAEQITEIQLAMVEGGI